MVSSDCVNSTVWVDQTDADKVYREKTCNHLQKLCRDTGCSLEDQPGAMDDRDE